MDNSTIRYYTVIIGISSLFLVFGLWELISPDYWIGYVPETFGFVVNLLVRLHGILLTVIGICILTGYFVKAASIAGTLVIGHIVVTLIISSGFNDLVVRDISLMLLTLSIYFEDHKNLALLLKRN